VSASVRGLPSLAASWIAVIGRQKFQWYLLFQLPIAASAAARSAIANIRALSVASSRWLIASVRITRFQNACRWSCQ
jgi:hypothetical protein